MKGWDRSGRSIAVRCALGALAAGLAVADGCGWIRAGDAPAQPYAPMVEWPESAPVDLEAEIAASAVIEGDEEPGLLPDETPGVFAREDEIEGLSYLEVVIGDAHPRSRMPMVVFLHGRGDHPRIPGGPFLGLPVPVRVIVFRAPIPLGNGWTWLPVRVGENKTDELAASIAEITDRLALAIDGLAAAQETSGKPVVCGFSQGGILSYALAVLHPESVGAAFPLAGWLPPDLIPARPREAGPLPLVWAMHGTEDEVVPYGPTREMIERLWTIGVLVRLVEFPGARHGMTVDMDALFHEWIRAAIIAAAGGTPMPTLMAGTGTPVLPPLAAEAGEAEPVPDASAGAGADDAASAGDPGALSWEPAFEDAPQGDGADEDPALEASSGIVAGLDAWPETDDPPGAEVMAGESQPPPDATPSP